LELEQRVGSNEIEHDLLFCNKLLPFCVFPKSGKITESVANLVEIPLILCENTTVLLSFRTAEAVVSNISHAELVLAIQTKN